MRRFLFALPLLAACTGENVDEAFLAQHGALLARVECVNDVRSFRYDALMFLDGSVLAHVSGAGTGQRFFERSDAGRTHAQLNFGQESDVDCPSSGPQHYFRIESGDLNLYDCKQTPHTYEVRESMDIDTECSGHNKHLFD